MLHNICYRKLAQPRSRQLQDDVGIAQIEKRQSSLLRERSERIVSIERSLARSAQLDEEVREIQKHGDERLNALIALVDRMVRKPPPQ